jgi:phosphoenolpyruvate-protein kinase (PTS system EI component)
MTTPRTVGGVTASDGIAIGEARLRDGDTVVVDGWRGDVVARPDRDVISKYEARCARDGSRLQALKSRNTARTATQDDVWVDLGANMEALSEVAGALEPAGADDV